MKWECDVEKLAFYRASEASDHLNELGENRGMPAEFEDFLHAFGGAAEEQPAPPPPSDLPGKLARVVSAALDRAEEILSLPADRDHPQYGAQDLGDQHGVDHTGEGG
jgi:hypothetical protein